MKPTLLEDDTAMGASSTETGRIVSDSVFGAYLQCKYKSYLMLRECTSNRNPYEAYQERLHDAYCGSAEAKLASGLGDADVLRVQSLTLSDLKLARELILNTTFGSNDLRSTFHALKKHPGQSRAGAFHYEPVLYCRSRKPGKKDKLLLAFQAMVMNELQGAMPSHGLIICGPNHTTAGVRLDVLKDAVCSTVDLLRGQSSDATEAPLLVLGSHCDKCGFSGFCRERAAATDNLSLLRGMKESEIRRHNARGIFTVHQLSYTFRPRKTPKRAKRTAKPHHSALKALAIRENRVYIHNAPVFPASETRVFLDIEGLPDRDLHYLIGAIVDENGAETHHHFWADTDDMQRVITTQFLDFMASLATCRVFHYGRYDVDALKRLRRELDGPHQKQLDEVLNSSTNVLSYVYPHVYFPTYSNGLKDIGRFLGSEWSMPDSSGLDSILWRDSWERNHNPALKARILQYNKEDCIALRTLSNFIASVSSGKDVETTREEQHCRSALDTSVLRSSESKRPLFRRPEFVFEEFEFVNKCAYFDYQRDKVYVRTAREFRQITKRIGRIQNRSRKPNTTVLIRCKECPYCKRKRSIAPLAARGKSPTLSHRKY